jgi:hypothetical protein
MDNIDPAWEELNRMATAACASDALMSNKYPTPETIERWKRLFGYTHLEAVRLISDQRCDHKYSSFTRATTSLTLPQ